MLTLSTNERAVVWDNPRMLPLTYGRAFLAQLFAGRRGYFRCAA
jgi:hypothetical protein